MEPPEEADLCVVGAGIVGLAVARELLRRSPEASLCVLEREAEIGRHQTGHNSGVIHTGIYYEPGSLKARLCVEGARELYAYCEDRGIPARSSGKLIVALEERELPALAELERRGHANGVLGLRRLGAGELREVEPEAAGVAALHSPQSGTVDFGRVAHALREDVEAAGGTVATGCDVRQAVPRGGSLLMRHTTGETGARSAGGSGARSAGETRTGFAVFCAGAAAGRLAVACGAPADPRVVRFRGAYLRVRGSEGRELVRSMIYPVPDPALPFLGVHLTRHHGGDLLVGPTALLAGGLTWPGTYRLAGRHWRAGLAELRRAARPRALAREAARYVPAIGELELEPAFAGHRAQALGRDGTLLDDFVTSRTARALHVRNAPSPAATSALALARLIADRAEEGLG